ncbi:MAG: shikimate dehydrogenase [Nonlabens sp.]|nr:shikimate dehydrogenase [Nonlabens sp.]
MEKMSIPKSVFGLLGKRLDYSFSRAYFSEKFEKLKLHDHVYRNFEIPSAGDLVRFRESVTYNSTTQTTNGVHEIVRGFNVTIPYKEAILPLLDHITPEAETIGAVNTVVIEDNVWTGHNTDAYGFGKSLEPFAPIAKNALILGTGGASKAIAYTLEALQIPYLKVSRNPDPDDDYMIDYKSVNKDLMQLVSLIVNTTPLGTHPDVDTCAPIPYEFLTKEHVLYDLTYNPQNTLFMKKGAVQGARVTNGGVMLVHQAEKAWELWNM